MAVLGSPQTGGFFIGTAEVRVGPVSSAGKLSQSHSIGLVDSASVTVEQTTVDLLGGFPQLPADTAVTGQTSSVTATLREYSRRNLNILMGGAVQAYDTTDLRTAIDTTTALAAGATVIPVTESAGFVVGDIVGLAVQGSPELVTISRVAALDTVPPDGITLETDLGLVAAIPAGSTAVLYKIPSIAVGNITTVNYVSTSLVFTHRKTGRPVVYHAWKSAINSSATLSLGATDFASTELSLKLLVPAASEYAVGQPLAHLANIIPSHPVGMWALPSDFASAFV